MNLSKAIKEMTSPEYWSGHERAIAQGAVPEAIAQLINLEYVLPSRRNTFAKMVVVFLYLMIKIVGDTITPAPLLNKERGTRKAGVR
ncbi:hypothetical protein SD81_006780 [Tolypothrix campylonemoides VB511288]|nr:hypothetical protein SD81_006780 [Tolypothrix campylonemoides VB511288]